VLAHSDGDISFNAADVSVVLRAASLLGQLLGLNNVCPCHLRVTSRTGAPVDGGLRYVCQSHCGATISDAAPVDGQRRRHIPDYLLLTDDGPVVVDVKPADLLDDTAVAETFEWVRAVVESLGWSFEVASEQPCVLMENVRFFAGFGGVRGSTTLC